AAHGGQRAVLSADRRADGIDDERVHHQEGCHGRSWCAKYTLAGRRGGIRRIESLPPSISSRIEYVTSPPSTTMPSSFRTTTDWWPAEVPGGERAEKPSKNSRSPD